MPSPEPTHDKKKRRVSLGRMLGKKDKDSQETRTSSELPPASSTSAVGDSAYASSENEHIVPMQNTGQITGVSADKNLALDKQTGNVLDDDTGEVVSTVTTTTTTTTTTTKVGGKAGEKKVVQVTTTPGTSTPGIPEMPADGPSNTLDPSSANGGVNAAPALLTPEIPNRSPNRKSREENPVSPVDASNAQQPNFSYPSRSTMKEPVDPAARQSGTIDNLKAAAIGLHGVGETLRGTINSKVDSQLGRRDPTKAATIEAKNQATLERGQREMAGLRERQGLSPSVVPDRDKDLPNLPHDPQHTYHPNAPNSRTNLTALPNMQGRDYVPPHGTAVPVDPYYTEASQAGDRSSTSYETATSFDNNDYQSNDGGGKRTLRKLMKRKPVRGS